MDVRAPPVNNPRRRSNGTPPGCRTRQAECTARPSVNDRRSVPSSRTSSLRHDLRRRVLETNLIRESGPSSNQTVQPDLVTSSTGVSTRVPTPPRNVRRWGYCRNSVNNLTRNDARPASVPIAPTGPSPVRAMKSPPVPAPRRPKSPRKLGSPRHGIVVSAAAIKRRLRRSWSYREAIAGDEPAAEDAKDTDTPASKRPKREAVSTATAAEDAEETPSSKRQKREPASTATAPDEAHGKLFKRPCRVQHGKPFAIPIPPALPRATCSARGLTPPQWRQHVHNAGTSLGCVTPPLQRVGPSSAGAATREPGSSHPITLPPSSGSMQGGGLSPSPGTFGTPPTPYSMILQSALHQNMQNVTASSAVAPCLDGRIHASPTPSLVTQGTQTSPKIKLRRRSSLRRALERILNNGKENTANASQDSAPKDRKAAVKRRPSLVESLLFKRSSSGSKENQVKHDQRSGNVPAVLRSNAGSTPPRNRPRRARSLQLKAPAFDPWG
ncbi:uncharacterized protein LOC144138586 [Haemaphysalis longicornis]